MALVKKLTVIGNSMGILIERPILDLLGIDRDTPLEVRTDGRGLYITAADEKYLAKVRESATRLKKVHGATLKKLAE